jgi:hypothetical protein
VLQLSTFIAFAKPFRPSRRKNSRGWPIVREPKADSRDLAVAEQLKGALQLFSCGVGLLLVLAGQVVVSAFWPDAADRYRGATR